MRGLNSAYEHPLELEELAVVPLAGGVLQHGYQCGMLWGSTLAAGAQSFRLNGTGAKAEIIGIFAAQNLTEAFRSRNKFINCVDITNIDKNSSAWEMTRYFFIKGGVVGCMRKISKFVQEAYRQVEHSLSTAQTLETEPPVSCASLMAQMAGASDLHIVMASGLAGGIGLSGGACGALGAAIWLVGLKTLQERKDAILFNDDLFNSKANELISKFLKITDYEFECSKIADKRFESINDHAAYLKEAGCSKLIEALAAETPRV